MHVFNKNELNTTSTKKSKTFFGDIIFIYKNYNIGVKKYVNY